MSDISQTSCAFSLIIWLVLIFLTFNELEKITENPMLEPGSYGSFLGHLDASTSVSAAANTANLSQDQRSLSRQSSLTTQNQQPIGGHP